MLPFKVQDDDVLLLNLIDDDGLTDAEEAVVSGASKSATRGNLFILRMSYMNCDRDTFPQSQAIAFKVSLKFE